MALCSMVEYGTDFLWICLWQGQHTLKQVKSVECTTCLLQRHQCSSRSSSPWSHTYHHSWLYFYPFTVPPCELHRMCMEFKQNESYQKAPDSIKCMVCTDTTLWYFDICKPITIQFDASPKGLGAALLQACHPVTFASKALIPIQECIANIGCEILINVFGVE